MQDTFGPDIPVHSDSARAWSDVTTAAGCDVDNRVITITQVPQELPQDSLLTWNIWSLI